MAIAIQLDDAFDIETYDGLQAYLTAFLELDAETIAQLPTFIRKAEYRLNRLCTAPERETSATLTTVSGEQSVDLPVDYRQLRQARILGDTGYPLAPVSLNVLQAQFEYAGKPVAYTIAEQAVQFGPVPDAAYSVTLTYMARIPPLSPTNQTNWLLAGNADAYVYATAWQIAAWQENFTAAEKFRAELFTIIEEVNLQGNRYRNSSPMRLRSPVVV